jgi:ATP synthase F1 complex assembly factor 1
MISFKPRYLFGFTYPCPQKLREVVRMTLIEREAKDKIIQIWQDHHKNM